jgi:hypothetical protein
MRWAADDFVQPVGQLNPAWFPNADLTVSVQAWLDDAESKTDDTNAQQAWVYYRAFQSLADDFHQGVATAREGEITGTRSEQQFRYWSRRADRELARYRDALGTQVVF